ncbi:erythrocyte membrane protein 1, PfEMP1, putative [Plasmodium sp. gorilla clade G1]|nr:erythrocyte membrane protein 1, PfEMP1, putative [Plasmodium sp. gorilla clade G1]
MDNTNINVEKIEEYLKAVSDDSNIDQSLKADPSEIDYYNFGGDGGYLRKNICKITVNHSDSGTNDPCNGKASPYGDNGQWKCDKNLSNPSEKHKNICVPHRRERLCTYNLEKLNVEKIRDNNAFLADVLLTARNEGEKIILNHPDTNSSNVCVALERSFADLADIIRGTDQRKGANTLEQNLRRMFKNIIEKGSIPQSKYPKNDQKHTKLREAWWNANRQQVWEVITCGARSNDLLIKRVWTQSGESDGKKNFELCRKCGHYEEKVPTKLDYVPQFLRWLTEWIEDFYRQKQHLIHDMERHREECTRKNLESKEVTSDCTTCKDKCKKYCEFMKNRESEWENEKNKYRELYQKEEKKTSRYDDYVKEFFKNLKDVNFSSLDDYIKNDPYFTEYASKLSFILNSSDGSNASETSIYYDEACNCNESGIPSVGQVPISVPSSEKGCITHRSIKGNKKKKCKYVKLGVDKNDRDLNVCVIEDTSLSVVENCCCQDLLGMLKEPCSEYKESSARSNVSCDQNSQETCQKEFEEVVASLPNVCKCEKCKSQQSKRNDNKWIWKIFNGKGEGLQDEYANTIGLPPRTQYLYLGNLYGAGEKKKDKNIRTNSELLKEWIIVAFHEGRNLKISHQKKNDENNTKLCKALKYSFADYGDLIKGTSIWDNDFTKDLELNLQKTFGKLFGKYIKKNTSEENTYYSSLAELRESWWNTNKKYIWLAMKYGAGMNGTRCCGGVSSGSDSSGSDSSGIGDNSGSGGSCNDMPTIDLIPQYLRFLQEWVEHFCKQRQEKVKGVMDSCNSFKNNLRTTKIGEKCKSQCKSKCEEYKKFIEDCGGGTGTAGSAWSKRWDQVYKRYSKHIEDAKRNLEAGTKSCGTGTGGNKCVQSDIDSFFKHLIDIGLTTPSSYLSNVLDDNICGDDNAPWTKYTTYATTIEKRDCDKNRGNVQKGVDDTPVDIIVPSPLGNTPYEYKYVCECRTPNKQESCDDRKEYMNQWNCDSAQKPNRARPGNSDYKLCKYNGVEIKQPPRRSSSNKLDGNDVTFFNLFEQWNKEIQYQIEQYLTNTKMSCNNQMNVLTIASEEGGQQNVSGNENGGNKKTDHIKECNEKCECYKIWMNKINKQWETQNQNYNKFETKQSNYVSKGPQKNEIVKLSNFLFFSCWEEYIQKQFNGDWSKIKNIGSDTFEFLIKNCGNNSDSGKEIFNKKLINAKQKCNESESKDTKMKPCETSFQCNETNYIRGCQSKNYDGFMSPGKGGEKQWICKDTITHGYTNSACIPPRTQNLCVGELWDKSYGGKSNIKNDTKDKLKKKIKNAIQKETELLYEYHDKGTAIISQTPMKEEGEGKVERGEDGKANNNNSNGLPKGFCHAVQRSFIDYKNMILGTSVNTYEHIGKLQEDIKKIIEQGTTQRSGKAVGGADKVNDWWKGIEGEMWDGVKCGIKTISEQTKNSKINCDECGIFPPTGNDADQFVSWFKEWGEQFCIERLQYKESIRKACTNNGQGKEIQRECKIKCEEYKTYISEKKEEWDKQKTKYENKYVGKSASDLLKENYPECISANFDFIFNDNVEYKTYYPYGDYSSICSCEEVKYNEYKKDKGQNNKSLCREKCNDMTWSKKYIKKLENDRSLEGVYVPPRRQQLCLYEIFPIIIKKNKNDTENVKKELLETLKIVAEREAYYLWKQYHANNDATYLAHKKACCAIRASFYDLGDIIKGNDLVHDEYTKYIDTSLNKIFGGSNNNNDIETKRSRRDWWENETVNVANETDHKTRRQLVWYAMQSGVRYAIKEENEKKKQKKVETEQSDQKGDQESDTLPLCMVVEHIGIAKPQFIRWLEEWTNEFCEEYTTYFRAINSNCKNTTGPNDCGDNSNIACKKACTNYTNWLNPKRIEWTGMSNYYNKIYRKSNKESEDGEDYSMIMAPTVIQYLNKRCDGDINGNYICCSCKDIGENKKPPTAQKQKVPNKKDEDEEEKGPLDLMNEVLNKMDEKYSKHKMMCTEIYLEHIEEQLKEIDNAIKDYKLYPLDRCFVDKNKMKVCDLIGDAIGCKNKSKLDELDEWNDVDMRDPYNKHKGVLIPPRRRQLCFSSIVRGPKNLRNLNEFKKEILKGALSEGKFLGNYYNDDKEKEKKEDRKEKVLEAMKNSFYDYEDIIKGSDMLQNIEYKDIKLKLEKLLDKETNNKQNAEAWWKANNKSIWNAMLCGYNKSGNKIIDPSWCTMPTTEKTPQFLRWIKEWGTNVCIQKEKYKKNVKSECSNVINIDSDQQASQSTKCIPEITKYQEWNRKRFFQWERISERYNKDKKSFRNVNQPDANAYLKEHCSKCPCGFNDMEDIAKYTNIGNEAFKEIKEKVDIPAELEDVIYRIKNHKYNSNDYICNKYNIKKNIYDGIKNKNANTWNDNLVNKSWEINNSVLLPPRRKNLFPKIDPSQICQYKKNPKMFKYFIYSSAFTEVERLNKAYRQDKEKVAHAMKYSFVDIGNIIKGNDIMKSNTSNDIGKILGDEDGKKGNRKKWWDSNKYHIWESMLCGYKHVFRNISENDKTIREIPTNDNEHQLLRWFTEWAEDFCIKQKEELKTLREKCNFGTCDNATPNQKSACQLSCNTYKKFLNKWEKEYLQHYSIYNSLQDTILVIKNKEPYEYLKDTCENRCSCLHKRDGIPVNNAFMYPPKEVEGKCPCPIKGVIIPPKETTTTKTRKSEKTRQLYTDNHLEKCPFENSGDGTTTTVINNDSCKNLNLNRQCIQNEYKNNLDQWKGSIVKNMSDENKGVLVPPRRRHLCRTPFIGNIYRSKDEDIFRNDFYIATFNQGYLLGKTFKDYNDEGHEALKNSFADYEDIIKGTDMLETTTHTDIKTKLEKLLENAQNTDERNGIPSKPKDANDWWKTNKNKVWHAMLCGYHQGVTEPPKLGGRKGRQSQTVTAPTSLPTTKIPSNWCKLPNDDSTDQFLRWLREWGTQYCKEKEQLKSDINLECKSHLDKYAIIENKKDIHPKCLEKLQKYEVWSNNRLLQWKGLSEKFTKDTDDKKYTNVEEKSADTYLKQNCSECKCSFNDIEQTHKKSINGGNDIYVDILDKAQVPSYLEDKAYRYKGLDPKIPEDSECNKYENIRCEGLPHDDDRDWKLSFVKDTRTTNKAVLVPPRRRHLCLSLYPQKIDHLRKEIENFKNFICSSAFAESRRLKKVYKDDDSKLPKAMKYSFADIGNIVKGDDMMESAASDNIAKIFNGSKYKGIDRTKWWNENKYDVWESMLCAYKEDRGNLLNNEYCTFPDADSVPQFLRWFQEWTENFCTRRNELYKNMDTACKSVECNTSNGSVDKSKCTQSCEKYKNYVLSKKTEYEIQKNKYNAEFKNKYVIVKDAPDYFKNKCKNNCDCLSKKFSDDNKWNEPYNTFDDNSNLKDKCECTKSQTKTCVVDPSVEDADATPHTHGGGLSQTDGSQEADETSLAEPGVTDQTTVEPVEDIVSGAEESPGVPGTTKNVVEDLSTIAPNSWEKIADNVLSLAGTAGIVGTYGTIEAISAAAPEIISQGSKYGGKAAEIGIPFAKNAVTDLFDKLKEFINPSGEHSSPAGETQKTGRGKAQRTPPPPPPPPIIPPPIYLIYRKNKKKKTTCEIVGEILRGKNEKSPIDGCYPKNNDNNYPEWKCGKDSNLVTEDGVCMPPRRQKLCLHYLKQEITDTEGMKNAFVKCAAAETFFLWEKYKKDMNGSADNLYEKLKSGSIPEDFKLQMFYTYGDYRDLCLNTDISSKTDKHSDVSIVKMNIDDFFSTIRQSSIHDRKNWWERHGPTIWEGMVCALTNEITEEENKKQIKDKYSYKKLKNPSNGTLSLEDFSKTPQFLRWFTEWAQNFCYHQKKEIKKIGENCIFDTCEQANVEKKKQCSQQCNRYKEFLRKWKDEYKRQNIKYEGLTDSINIINNKEAPKFFTEHCKEECSCFNEIQSTNIDNLFVKLPDEYKNKCYCSKQIPVHDNEHTGKPADNIVSVDKIIGEPELLDKCPYENTNNDICNKYNTNRLCGKKKNSNLIEHWYGKDMLIPPRRRKICLRNITGKEFYRTQDGKTKFKNALLSAAVSEASFLTENYKDKNEALQAIKYTFADIGDIIKGKDKMDDRAYQNIKVKLEKVLDSSKNDPENSSEWWKQNKKYIWHALLCGYKKSGGTIENNDCNIPSEENTDQLLRWLTEWGRQACKEKSIKKRLVDELCNNSNARGRNSSNKLEQSSCKNIAMVYDNWNKYAYNSLVQLNKEYKRYIGTSSNSQKPTESSAEDYLKKTCNECDCSFSDIKKTYERSIKPDFEVLKDIVNKSHVPSHLEDIFNKYSGPYLNCPDSQLCSHYKSIPCYGLIHNDDMDWESKLIKNNNRTNMGVLLPPRRKHLCLRIYPEKFYHLRKKINNFKIFICSSAFAEAKRLKKVYKEDNNKILHAMKYSFADIGNIVKGDDMMESRTSTYMDELFIKKYSETDRIKWWNENKYHVWESMLCGYREAGGNTETNENCRFPDIETVPQFFRWFIEWSEHYCRKYNDQYEKLQTACSTVDCTKEPRDSEKEKCKKACASFKTFVEAWKKQYDSQKNKFNQEKNKDNIKNTYKGIDDKEAHEYLVDECKGECNCIKDKTEYDTNGNDLKVFDTPPKEQKGKCECVLRKKSACENNELPEGRTQFQMTCDDLKNYSDRTSNHATKINLMEEITNWEQHPEDKYYIPVRRKHLFLKNIDNLVNEYLRNRHDNITEEKFDRALQKDAYNEAKKLYKFYSRKGINSAYNTSTAKNDEDVRKQTIEAMKRSYADYGDLVKGTTEYKNFNGYENIQNMLKQVVDSSKSKIYREVENSDQLWKKYKANIWNAMLCGYKNASSENKIDENICNLPNNDETNEFLRWLIEWGETFCFHQNIKLNMLMDVCSFNSCNDAKSDQKSKCQHECNKYKKDLQRWYGFYIKQYVKYDSLSDINTENEGNELHEFWKKNCDTKCKCLHERDNTNVNKVFIYPPKEIEGKCSCPVEIVKTDAEYKPTVVPKTPIVVENPYESLKNCPAGSNGVCKNYGNDRCQMKRYDENTPWTSFGLKNDDGKNTGVLIPPRRRYLCLQIYMKLYHNSEEIKFKDTLFKGAASEAKRLTEKYGADREKSLESMKYSFADIGNIIKGDDMLNDTLNNKISINLKRFITKNKKTFNGSLDRIEWWNNNKTFLWHSMLCGYIKAGGEITSVDCKLPNEYETPQFLRWLKEWGQYVCTQKYKIYESMKNACNKYISEKNESKDLNNLENLCKETSFTFKQFIYNRKREFDELSSKYDNDQKAGKYNGIKEESAEKYLNEHCFECDCNYKILNNVFDWKKNTEDQYNEIIKKTDKPLNINIDTNIGSWVSFFKPKWPPFRMPGMNIFGKIKIGFLHPSIFPFPEPTIIPQQTAHIVLSHQNDIQQATKTIKETFEDTTEVIKNAVDITKDAMKKILSTRNTEKNDAPTDDSISTTTKAQNDNQTTPNQQTNETYINTIPEIYVPACSLALLILGYVLYKWKNRVPRCRRHADDIIRILEMPQNDYSIPTGRSTNRYVPYESGRYAGKTYIYMEGDETDDYNYFRDIYSSDITSSSESEYEEVDINDIYVPSLPKYKTFIELVLEPSKRDTFNTSSGDTFTNKLTDDEWNQLKQDFIEQYLTHIGPSLPLYNELPDDNMYMDTQPNILHDSMDEKPFITQIQDRFLDSSHEEVIYNIDWNVPENINRINNIMHDTKYCSNNLYTGTDLINDSLNGNQHMDIYDEMLKRKENELFGTNNTKNTTFNSVYKQTHSDPIINQLNLYHKWLDKHRDICEQWKTKEDMLHKLNEVWNMERKEYLLDILPSTLDDIHKINDETYNIISTYNIYDNPSQETSLQPLGSTNIIPSYITTEQNNGLRTNISMDIHIDEKNYNNVVSTSIIGDDQVENSYNL